MFVKSRLVAKACPGEMMLKSKIKAMSTAMTKVAGPRRN
jgi:hypothetical protein